MVSLRHSNILGTRWTDKINENKIMRSLVNGFFYLILSSIRKAISQRESSSDNVVVVSLHRLGDSVFTIPALRQIKNAYPKQIIILCFKETKPIYNLIFDESELLVVERKQFKLNGRYATKKIRSLVSELDPKMILDLNGDMASASLLYLLGVKEIYGLCRPQFRAIYKKCITVRKVPHIIDIYLDAISTIIQLENRNDIYEFPTKINKQEKILIHPSAGWSAKEWGLTKFLELGEKLSKTFSIGMIFKTGLLSSDVRNEIKKTNITLFETENIEELIETTNNCFLFISNDSGPLYIAGLRGVPTFTIYGPTNPLFHLPFGQYHDYIQSDLKCIPKSNEKLCFANGGRKGCPAFECMNQLSVDTVHLRISKFIEKLLTENIKTTNLTDNDNS